MPEPTTLIFDSEESSACYVDLYSDELGTPGPLFPVPVPVLGVSGKQSAGKTKFLLDIAGGPIKRVSIGEEMLKIHPSGYRPIDVFTWWHAIVKTIPPGKFRVIALDVAEDVEQGCADWVWDNPLSFNQTRAQFIRASGIFQGTISSFWKSIINDISARCETFAFANHIGLVFGSDGKPVANKTKNKGRPVLSQLCSVYIRLSRDFDANGNPTDPLGRPSGSVSPIDGGKSRLMCKVVRGGVKIMQPVLPPRMPVATPDAIRAYFAAPPDFSRLTDREKSPEHVMTVDERDAMRLTTLQAEAEVERLKLERISEERKAAAGGNGGNGYPLQQGAADAEPMFSDEPIVMDSPVAVAPQTPTPAPSEPAAATLPGGRLVGRNILDYLGGKSAPVTDATLFADMHRLCQYDSNQVITAAKRLREKGELRIVTHGESTYLGLPAMTFPGAGANGDLNGGVDADGRVVPTAKATAPAPTPATAAAPAVNGHAHTAAPAVPASPGYIRPACLAATLSDSVTALWVEFAQLAGWSSADADAAWSAGVLSRYGCVTGNELTDANLMEVEQNLVKKIHAMHCERGTPLASPFHAEFSGSTARVS